MIIRNRHFGNNDKIQETISGQWLKYLTPNVIIVMLARFPVSRESNKHYPDYIHIATDSWVFHIYITQSALWGMTFFTTYNYKGNNKILIFTHFYFCRILVKTYTWYTNLANLMLIFPTHFLVNPLTAKLFNLNFHPLEVVSRWRDPQLQVGENYSDLTKWRSTFFKYCWSMSHFIHNMFKRWYLMC